MEYSKRRDVFDAYWMYYCYFHSGGLTSRDRARAGRHSIGGLDSRYPDYKTHRRLNLTDRNLSRKAKQIYLGLILKWESKDVVDDFCRDTLNTPSMRRKMQTLRQDKERSYLTH